MAPWLAGKLGENVSIHAPFWMGAAAVAVGIVILAAGRRFLVIQPPAPHSVEEGEHSVEEAELVAAADLD